MRWRVIDDDEKFRGELDLGKSEPHEAREEDGEQEEEMANPMRASGWPDVARRRAVRGGAMAGAGGVLSS